MPNWDEETVCNLSNILNEKNKISIRIVYLATNILPYFLHVFSGKKDIHSLHFLIVLALRNEHLLIYYEKKKSEYMDCLPIPICKVRV